jgi:hypothetical protein
MLCRCSARRRRRRACSGCCCCTTQAPGCKLSVQPESAMASLHSMAIRAGPGAQPCLAHRQAHMSHVHVASSGNHTYRSIEADGCSCACNAMWWGRRVVRIVAFPLGACAWPAWPGLLHPTWSTHTHLPAPRCTGKQGVGICGASSPLLPLLPLQHCSGWNCCTSRGIAAPQSRVVL